MRLEIQISVCLARPRWYRPRPVFINLSLFYRFEMEQTTYLRDCRCAYRFFAFCDGKKCVVFDKKCS